MPRGGARRGTGGRRPGAGRPFGSQNARTKSIHTRLAEVGRKFAKIVGDEKLIKAIWIRALDGDSACLRLCAEYMWGKPREAADLNVEEPVRGEVIYRCTLPGSPSVTARETPADDPDEEDPDTQT